LVLQPCGDERARRTDQSLERHARPLAALIGAIPAVAQRREQRARLGAALDTFEQRRRERIA
jgi:hypothetical protein